MNGKGEEAGVLGQDVVQGRAVIDDDVVIGKPGLGVVPAVIGAEDPNLVPDPLELHITFMHQPLTGHRRIPY